MDAIKKWNTIYGLHETMHNTYHRRSFTLIGRTCSGINAYKVIISYSLKSTFHFLQQGVFMLTDYCFNHVWHWFYFSILREQFMKMYSLPQHNFQPIASWILLDPIRPHVLLKRWPCVSRNGLLFWIKFHITHENKRLWFSTSAN